VEDKTFEKGIKKIIFSNPNYRTIAETFSFYLNYSTRFLLLIGVCFSKIHSHRKEFLLQAKNE
jgi:hypothetical protein